MSYDFILSYAPLSLRFLATKTKALATLLPTIRDIPTTLKQING